MVAVGVNRRSAPAISTPPPLAPDVTRACPPLPRTPAATDPLSGSPADRLTASSVLAAGGPRPAVPSAAADRSSCTTETNAVGSSSPPPGPASSAPFPRPRRPAPAAPHPRARPAAHPPVAAALPGLPATADTTLAAWKPAPDERIRPPSPHPLECRLTATPHRGPAAAARHYGHPAISTSSNRSF